MLRRVYLAAATVALLSQLANAQAAPPFTGNLLIQPAANTAKCVTASSNEDGATVSLQACKGSAGQYWVFTDGQVRVFNNMCLQVPGGSTKDGTKLQIGSCSNGNPNQAWDFTWWDNQLSWTTHTNLCVDLTDGSLADGNPIQIWACSYGSANQAWDVGYLASNLPYQSQDGQYGYNACGTGSSQSSRCQTAWINSADDFCLWAPPHPNSTIGVTEQQEVAWCTKSGRGTRLIPDGTLKGVHFVKTPDYVQVTGVGDFTKLNIQKTDEGGELDDRGANGKGNPIGGLVYGNSFGASLQYHEFTSFISSEQFCFRACVGSKATQLCQHIYDEMGCNWNMPANYDPGVFENCDGDDDLPMGVYGTSTWHQGVKPTPTAHPVAPSSNCQALPTVANSPVNGKRSLNRIAPAMPAPTPITF
ncbi:hypothetical protein AX14_012864 [Amanita brunnescens Koide BX004]|nr:hypothetical protein AX14_012864 [Amanita brunnescens Koide BX004]